MSPVITLQTPCDSIAIYRLMVILDDLCSRLSENPPGLPSWIFVPTPSIPPILGAINYWIEMAKKTKTEKALELHEVPDITAPTASALGLPGPMFPNPENMTEYSQKLLREVASAGLDGMTGEQLVKSGLVPAYIPPSQAGQYRERHKSQLVDVMFEKLRADFPTADTDAEVKWYTMTKTFPVPKELEARHTVLKQLSGAVRRGKDIPRALVVKVAPSGRCSVSGKFTHPWTGTTGNRNDVEAQHHALCMFLPVLPPPVFNKSPSLRETNFSPGIAKGTRPLVSAYRPPSASSGNSTRRSAPLTEVWGGRSGLISSRSRTTGPRGCSAQQQRFWSR